MVTVSGPLRGTLSAYSPPESGKETPFILLLEMKFDFLMNLNDV